MGMLTFLKIQNACIGLLVSAHLQANDIFRKCVDALLRMAIECDSENHIQFHNLLIIRHF